MSPVLKYTGITNTILHQLIVILMTIALILNANRKEITLRLILFTLIGVIYALMQTLISNDLAAGVLCIFRYTLIPLFAYLACIEFRKSGKHIGSLLLPYLIVNLMIFYLRAFYSYDFFGVLDVALEEWMYRPSNLASPIIFAIEVAIALSLLMIADLKNGYKIIIVMTCIIPLLLMHSRSAGVIILIAALFYTILYYPKFWLFLILVLLLGLIMVDFDKFELPYFFSIFDTNEASYGSRFDSIRITLDYFLQKPSLIQFIGLGTLAASQSASSIGREMLYIESGVIAVLVEQGLLVFCIFILVIFLTTVVALRKRQNAFIISVVHAVILINLMSASLTVTSIWLIICFMLAWILTDKRRAVIS